MLKIVYIQLQVAVYIYNIGETGDSCNTGWL